MIKRHKLGNHRGKRRIWLEGKAVKEAGFIGGSRYLLTPDATAGALHLHTLSPHHSTSRLADGQQVRKVTGRPDGKPIIDILTDTFPPTVTHVAVMYDQGRIIITPTN